MSSAPRSSFAVEGCGPGLYGLAWGGFWVYMYVPACPCVNEEDTQASLRFAPTAMLQGVHAATLLSDTNREWTIQASGVHRHAP